MPIALTTPISKSAPTIKLGRVWFDVEQDVVTLTYQTIDGTGAVVSVTDVTCTGAVALANMGAGTIKVRLYQLLQFLIGASAAGVIS